MGLTMTTALPTDASDIAALRDRLAQWMVDQGIAQWRPGEYPAAQVADEAARGEWLISRDPSGCLAAAVRLVWSDPQFWGAQPDTPAGYLHGVMVAQSHRGEKLGEQILDHCAERIANKGIHTQRLDAAQTNPVLQRFYLAQGFTPVGEVRVPPPYDQSIKVTLFERAV